MQPRLRVSNGELTGAQSSVAVFVQILRSKIRSHELHLGVSVHTYVVVEWTLHTDMYFILISQ